MTPYCLNDLTVPLHGAPRPPGTAVFAIDDPADVAKLGQLLADVSDTGNRIPDTGKPEPQATAAGRVTPSGGERASSPVAVVSGSSGPQDPVVAADVRKPGNSVVTSAATGSSRTVEQSNGGSAANQTGGDARSPVGSSPSRDFAPPTISSSDHPTIRPAVSDLPDVSHISNLPDVSSLPTASSVSHISTLPNVSSFPSQSGAYVLIDGKWQPLPHNNGRFVQTFEQAQLLMSLMGAEQPASSASAKPTADMAEAGHPTIRSSDHPTIGTLTFDGDEPMPKVGAGNVTLVYIGARPQVPADAIAKYPTLRDEPAIELAPLKVGRGNVRSCALYFVPPGYTDFGPNRLAATLETPSDTITVLHTTQSLKAGRYAVSCGSQSFEIVVQK